MENRPENTEISLEEVWRLTKENNAILKAMRRDALIMSIIKILIWGLLIGGSVYFSLQFLEPLLAPAQQGSTDGMKALLELYNGNLP